uniref:tolloid-like protein 2 n=1 Tax=Myxine glutinosa TaxID=7769 RepID=UPI00358EBF16
MDRGFFFIILSVLPVVFGTSAQTDTIRSKFQRIPSNSMRGAVVKEALGELSATECAQACLDELIFTCVSFDYQTNMLKCLLYDQVAETMGGLQHTEGTDHYTLLKEGLLGRFLSYGYGALLFRSRVEYIGVSLEDCAENCLNEMTFTCHSFDYEYPTHICHLYHFRASHTGGISVDLTNHITHYERLLGPLIRFFYGTPNAAIKLGYNKTLLRGDQHSCGALCLLEEEFVCRSFDYDLSTQECHLSTLTERDTGGLQTNVSQLMDHFEMKQFWDCDVTLRSHYDDLSSSIRWPRHYPANQTCDYLIEVMEGNIIDMEKIHFNLHLPEGANQSDCTSAGDTLSIWDGKTDNASLIGTYCGQSAFESITSNGRHLLLRFISDASGSDTGYHFYYNSEWPCQKNFSKPGIFATPSHPHNPPVNHKCNWNIMAPENYMVHLEFLSIYLGWSLLCNNAKISVEAIPDESNTSVEAIPDESNTKVFCGFMINMQPFQSPGFQVTFSSQLDKGSGAFAYFWFIRDGQANCSTLVRKEGFILSPGFPESPQRSSVCDWIIEAPEEKVVEIRFTSFDVGVRPEMEECDFWKDHVKVQDGDSTTSSIIARLCGSATPLAITSSRQSMRLSLWTTNEVDYTGFNISVSFKELTHQDKHGSMYVIRLGKEKGGTLISSNWPFYNIQLGFAKWEIEAPPGKVIRLQWTQFNVSGEASRTCPHDRVFVYSGDDIGALFCSNILPPPVVSQSNTLNISFLSGFYRSKAFTGFRAIYTFMDKPEITTAAPTVNSPTSAGMHSIQGSLKLEKMPFIEDLNNRSSLAFRQLATSLQTELNQVFAVLNSTVKVQRFTPGSVVAEVVILAPPKQVVLPEEYTSRLHDHLVTTNGALGNFTVDVESIKFYQEKEGDPPSSTNVAVVVLAVLLSLLLAGCLAAGVFVLYGKLFRKRIEQDDLTRLQVTAAQSTASNVMGEELVYDT